MMKFANESNTKFNKKGFYFVSIEPFLEIMTKHFFLSDYLVTINLKFADKWC